MDKIIKTDDVGIKTVAVEIKAIKMGKKQMTQAVFKQLKYENILDDDMNLKGIPWGIVNYTTKEGQMHILWQKDDELRRCIYEKFLTYRRIRTDLLREKLMGYGYQFDMYSQEEKFQELQSRLEKDDPESFKDYVEKMENLDSVLEKINELDQLFIAV